MVLVRGGLRDVGVLARERLGLGVTGSGGRTLGEEQGGGDDQGERDQDEHDVGDSP